MPIASDLAIVNTADATTLMQTIFGNGVTISAGTASISGAAVQSGTYSGGDATLGDLSPADTGIILSTGDVASFTNTGDGTSTDTNTNAGTSTGHGGAGDADLDVVSGQTTQDAVVLEADFTTTGNFITMQFIFSSEEYLEYVNGGVNDAFGVWVNGVYAPFTPAANDLVSIDTINNASSSNLYLDNPAATDVYNTEMDGATVVMSIKAPVNPAGTNTIKIALADGGDDAFDSNVLIAANSVQAIALAFDDAVTMEPNTQITVDVLANDIDANGAGLTITEINGQPVVVGVPETLPTGEIVTLNADGTLTIENDGDIGSEVFTYKVIDGAGNSDIGFITVNTEAAVPNNFIVEGTAGNDTIDSSYVGDPQGDRIDNLDHSDSSNADSVEAGAGDDVINSADGNDTIDAGTGNDSVLAGAGADSVIGGDGDDTIFGQGGSDTILGGAGADSLDGDDGSDSIDGGSGADTIIGDAGDDTLNGGAGADEIYVSSGNNIIDGGTENDSIFGGTGEDTILDSAGDDSALGGAGKDTFDYTTLSGDDTIIGGEINDTTATDSGDKINAHDGVEGLNVVFSGDEAGTVTGGSGTVTFSEIEHFLGGQGSDTIDASASSVQQILDGGEGSDTIQGGSGNDLIAMGQTQDFTATDGDDDLLILEDGFGDDSIEGFEVPTDLGGGAYSGNDQVDVSGLTDGAGDPVNTDDVTVTDTNGDGSGDAILSFPNGESITLFGVLASEVSSEEQLIAMGIPSPAPPPNYIVEGTAGDDTINAGYVGDPEGDMVDANDNLAGNNDDSITAGAGNDSVSAGLGNDTIDAGDGDDTVLGGSGNDSIDGGLGADNIMAESGNDTINAGDGDDTVGASIGADLINGDAGNDSLSGGGLVSDAGDTIYGGTGNDTISGGNGDDSLFGNEDDDSISGDSGNDTIEGGTGNDTIFGGTGDDSINGDFGDDSIVGGAGNDFLRGSFGDDTILGGTGDDTLWGGFGDDSLVVDANFGDYTIEGEEDAEVLGDTMDVSAVTNALTWDLTNPNPEAGSFTDGTNTGTYVDIENIILGSGVDTLTLGTFGGSNTVSGFSAPTDTGGGTFSGNDQLDVSGLVDFDGNPTHTGNVTVTEVGGNAVLTFPNGESLTLVGVPAADVSTPAQLIAMGIPEGPDGYVDGTAGDDTIDGSYVGDPNFDRVDNNDALLPGASGDDDYIRAGAGNDSVVANTGDDIVEGGTGSDTIDGGTGNDTLSGEAGNDSLIGGLGDDSLAGGAGNDTLNGQIGDDVLQGGDGSDSFALEDDFGNDTIVGGEIDDASGDVLDMSGVGGALSYDLTGTDAEAGTVSDGTSTLTFSEIENITLSSGIDTIVLTDGSGDDTVSGFTQPFDDGFGTWVGIDQVDVSTMTDASGAIVNTGDVTVTDDGSGNAVLNFPGGESLTLIGVPPTAFPVPEALAAIGIPLADYIVEGTAAGDLIDSSYLGDPEGDLIDSGDGDPLLADSNSDSIEAGAGADTIFAGLGDDTIRGEDGDDVINAEAGDDSIDGGLGNDSIIAGAGADSINAGDGDDTVLGGGGDDTVEGGAGDDVISGGGGNDQLFGNDGDDTILAVDGFGDDTVVGSEVGETTGDALDLSGVAAEGVAIVYSGDESGIVTGDTTGDTIDFSEIENITATDNDDTIDAALDTSGVNIDAGAGDDVVTGGSGADTLDGGAGSDTISGGADGDLITAGAGDDTINVAQGDTVTGGDGDDFFNIVDLSEIDTDTITITGGEGDETNGDTLALNGLHDRDSLTITDPDDVNGGLSGTVTLLDGTIVNFTNIENIICFVPGTEIATPYGGRMIEDLSIGDHVVTQDNGIQRIRWIGTTTVPATEKFAPVRFSQSTFPGANGDLIVSPQHRMLFKGYQAELLFGENEVLVPALHLLDGRNVKREELETVTYIHIMFEQHEIIFAQGVATESFHPGSFGVDCLAPKARDELFALFPDMRSDISSYGQSARRSLRANEARVLQQF